MTTLTISEPDAGSTDSPSIFTFIVDGIYRLWHEYRLMRAIEQVPGTVMKDLGYPAASSAHAE